MIFHGLAAAYDKVPNAAARIFAAATNNNNNKISTNIYANLDADAAAAATSRHG